MSTESQTADRIVDLLGLEPHPTCGYATVTHQVFARDLRGLEPAPRDGRALATVLYFLVTPDAQLRLHRIPASQMYHHYAGSPLEVLLLFADGSGDVATVGPAVDAGMRPQLLVPAGTWHVSRLPAGARFALLGTTEWGRFDPDELELGDPAELARRYPAFGDWLSPAA